MNELISFRVVPIKNMKRSFLFSCSQRSSPNLSDLLPPYIGKMKNAEKDTSPSTVDELR